MTALTMTETLSVSLAHLMAAIAGRVRARRARQAERMEIASLLELDADRLADMGIARGDVRDALLASVPPGPSLTLIRARSARLWLSGDKAAG